MIKKEGVYVTVKTKKKARKLYKLLKEYNQDIYKRTLLRIKNGDKNDQYGSVVYNSGHWVGHCDRKHDNKTRVSTKVLRDVLSKEVSISKDSIIEKVKQYAESVDWDIRKIEENMSDMTDSCVTMAEWTNLEGGSSKAKLKNIMEDKGSKLLMIGKWYKIDKNFLFNFQGGKKDNFGFNHNGVWNNQLGNASNHRAKLATEDEVSNALKAEAEKRGYKEGVVIKGMSNGDECILNNFPSKLSSTRGNMSLGGYLVFLDGKWAEIVKVDKFKDLKQLYEKGYEIEEFMSFNEWVLVEHPTWNKDVEYRVRELKIGDWVKTSSDCKTMFEFVRMNDSRDLTYHNGLKRVNDEKLIEQLEKLRL